MKEWWGFSKSDGWVVLDRDINRSLNKEPSTILFVRAKDWAKVLIAVADWKSIPNEAVLTHLPDFQSLQAIKEEWRSKVKIQFFDEVHKTFLEKLGIESDGIEKYLGDRRSTICWSCHEDVDSDDNFKCRNCGWLICNRCGACRKAGCVPPSINRAIESSTGEMVFVSFKEALEKAKTDPQLFVTRSSIEGQWIVRRKA